jgi:prepilin-type N-terminal cleavage/methylation domain-containing protein
MTLRPSCPLARRRAFSLLEILVAVTLLTVIVSALLLTFTTTQRAFRLGVNQVDVMESGRTAMVLVGREVQMVTTTGTSNSLDFLALLPNGSQPVTQRLPGGETRVNVLQQLTFVSRVNDDWFVTAYRVRDDGLGVGALYRWIAQTNHADGVPALFALALAWQPDPARDSRVLDGVIHFRFIPFATLGGTNGLEVPEENLNAFGGVGYAFPDFRTTNALPAHLDLELGILEPQTLAHLRGKAGVGSFDAAAFLSERAGRVHLFKQRIPVRASLPPYSTLFSR